MVLFNDLDSNSERVARVCQHQLSFLLLCCSHSILRGLCYGNVSVCLSVYHTPVIVSNRYVKPILKLSRPSGSPIIQFFFLTAVPISNSKVTHSAGAKNTPEVGKIGDFRRKSPRLSRKRCEIGRFLLWNVNRKSWVPDRMVSFSMTLSVP